MLETLAERFSHLRLLLERKQGERQALLSELAEQEQARQHLSARLESLQKASLLLDRAAREARETARHRLEQAATAALRYVFGPDSECRIEVETNRNRPEAHLVTVRGDSRPLDPVEDEGGGVTDLISLALRAVFLELFQDPALAGPLLSDEPTKMLSSDLGPAAMAFLQAFHRSTGRQILLITHSPELAEGADRVFLVEKPSDTSVVRQHVV